MKQPLDFLRGHAEKVAPQLLGCEMIRTFTDGTSARVKIVETEAYHQTDAASHSYNGQTPRTAVMFGPSGHAYVYFTYGLHFCFNIVTGEIGEGSAVLIRAVEPIKNSQRLEQNRSARTQTALTNGPAKLCQALQIDRHLLGHDLRNPPLKLIVHPMLAASDIITSQRIGISRATDKKWRFAIRNNPYVSR